MLRAYSFFLNVLKPFANCSSLFSHSTDTKSLRGERETILRATKSKNVRFYFNWIFWKLEVNQLCWIQVYPLSRRVVWHKSWIHVYPYRRDSYSVISVESTCIHIDETAILSLMLNPSVSIDETAILNLMLNPGVTIEETAILTFMLNPNVSINETAILTLMLNPNVSIDETAILTLMLNPKIFLGCNQNKYAIL